MAFVSLDLFPDFEPHGLITSPFLEGKYRSTRGYPREVKTLVLLEDIFNKVLFKDRNDVTVNSGRSSSPSDYGFNYDQDKCHFVVKYYDKEDRQREILCFTENVRDVNDMSVLGEFEAQVMRNCRKYLIETTCDFVYVCTAFWTCLRVWKLFRGDHEFGSLWGGYGPTVDTSSYLDVGNDDSSRQIQQALDQITSQSREPGNEDTTSFYPSESAHTIALGKPA